MMGVAGGGARASTILLTGVAGLIGGACSMALGEWLSVTNAQALAALFAIGLATTLFNGRSALFSGSRQIAIGAAAAPSRTSRGACSAR